jgi:hypothetical protein
MGFAFLRIFIIECEPDWLRIVTWWALRSLGKGIVPGAIECDINHIVVRMVSIADVKIGVTVK